MVYRACIMRSEPNNWLCRRRGDRAAVYAFGYQLRAGNREATIGDRERAEAHFARVCAASR